MNGRVHFWLKYCAFEVAVELIIHMPASFIKRAISSCKEPIAFGRDIWEEIRQ